MLHFLQTHTRPAEAVFLYPYCPVYYFWANVRNPTRYSILIYGYNTEQQFREAIATLERERVHYVLWDEQFADQNSRTIFPAYTPPPADKLIMEPYLNARYHSIGSVDGISVLERNGS